MLEGRQTDEKEISSKVLRLGFRVKKLRVILQVNVMYNNFIFNLSDSYCIANLNHLVLNL